MRGGGGGGGGGNKQIGSGDRHTYVNAYKQAKRISNRYKDIYKDTYTDSSMYKRGTVLTSSSSFLHN